jgi:hypothetical protein
MPSVHKPGHDQAAIPASARSALEKWELRRRRHGPRGTIAIHPSSDGAAILRRVQAEPIADEDVEVTQQNRA